MIWSLKRHSVETFKSEEIVMSERVNWLSKSVCLVLFVCLPHAASYAQTGAPASDEDREKVFQQFLTAVALAKSNIGASYFAVGEYDSAMVHLGDALSIAPDFAAAHLTVGLIEHARGNVKAALAAFHESASGDTVGQNRMMMVHPDTVLSWAQTQYRGIVKDPPGLAVSHSTLAMLYGQAGYVVDAEKHYRLALEHDPQHADGYTNLGKLFTDTERFQEARLLYEQALSLDIDSETRSKILLNLGVSYMGADSPDEAIKSWRSALTFKPDYSEALMNIGIGFQAKGMSDSARFYWERSLDINKDFIGARVALARLAVAESRLADARMQYLTIIDGGVNDPRMFAELAFVYERIEDFDTALSYYDQALTLAPDATEIRTSMAIVRNKVNEYSDALKTNKIRIRHIVVEQRAEAEDMLIKIRNGADFAELARTYSTDGTSVNGGDLGFFGIGEMLPAFEEAVNKIGRGEVTDVIQTAMGYHVIKREE